MMAAFVQFWSTGTIPFLSPSDGMINTQLPYVSVPKVHYLSLLDIVTLGHLAHKAGRLTEVIVLLVQLNR
jgi:hypothetical protein